MKTLLLMRHAKSDWGADYGSDHDRPLNRRGIESARLMGRVLSAESLAPSLVISSTAVRARHTAELAIEAGNWAADLVLERALYDEGPSGVITRASAAPDVPSLMLVGHQPTWSMLAARRADRLKTAADELAAAGARVAFEPVDVTVPEECDRLVAATAERLGRVDVLINNAGVGSAVPAVREAPEDFRRVLEVNLEGAY